MSLQKPTPRQVALAITFIIILALLIGNRRSSPSEQVQYGLVKKRSFAVEVYSTGELDAENSTTIVSTLRGDTAKLIDLITDGATVQKGDVIARVDPTPFEEKVNELVTKIQDQELYVASLRKTLDREKTQAEYDAECAQFESDAAQLELQKVVEGDGPLEMSRLRSTMSKAKAKCEELESYLSELRKLQSEDFATPGEITQCCSQIEQEEEAYDIAKQQYDNYVLYLLPSMVKRAELTCQKALSRCQDVQKNGQYKIANARMNLEQGEQFLERLWKQHHEAMKELDKTEFTAPSPGIVVHRSEFRGEKKRKPILGDILNRNQPLLEIPDLSHMVVRLKIREMDLHRVDLGQEATIEVDAFPGQAFPGTVSHIGILAQTDYTGQSREKCFDLVVRLDQLYPKLRPGMTARVTVHSNQYSDTLTIPSHAVFTQDRQYYCYVREGGRYAKREIDITSGNDQWAVVNHGLKDGDQVLLYQPTND